MSISLDNSTLGTEQSNVKTILDKIDNGLIKSTLDIANKNLSQLVETVDTMWVGVTADEFKNKVLKDKQTFISIMSTLANRMHQDIQQMSGNVANADALVASHMGVGGAGGDSYSGSGSSFEYNDDYYKGYEEVSGVLSQSENDILNALNDNIETDANGMPYADEGITWDDFVTGVERTGATIGTFGLSLVEGVGEFGEALVDCGALVTSVLNTPTTLLFDGGQAIYGAITGNEWESSTLAMWDGTMGFVSEKYVESAFDSFYEDTAAGQTLKEYCYGFDTTRGIGSGVGYTAGVVALSVVTCGAGGVAVGAGSAGTAAGAGALATTMAGIGGAAGFGRGTESAWADGASLGEGLAYGAANGVWEGAQFYVGGSIAGASPFAKEGLNVATRVGLDAVDAGLEGVVQPGLKTIYSDKSYGELFDEAGGWKNVGTQAAMGAAMSGVGEVTGAVKKYQHDLAVNDTIKQVNAGTKDIYALDIPNDVKKDVKTIKLEQLNAAEASGEVLSASDKLLQTKLTTEARVNSKTLSTLTDDARTSYNKAMENYKANPTTEARVALEENKVKLDTLERIPNEISTLEEYAKQNGFKNLSELGAVKYDEAVAKNLITDGSARPPDVSDSVQAFADQEAKRIYTAGKNVEPTISSDLRSLETQNMTLIGEDYRLKSESSLSRKLISEASALDHGKTQVTTESISKAASGVRDSVRYTYLVDADSYTESVSKTLADLKGMGYEVVPGKAKNSWGSWEQISVDSTGAPSYDKYYQGTNVNLVKEVNGEKVTMEVQFHTEDSFTTKERLTHALYEVSRNDFVDPKIKDASNKIQWEYQTIVDRPNNAVFTDFNGGN